jgi:hypothetical protein
VAGVPKPTNESSFCLQGLDVLSDVIYHLETFDVTTIRASTPMFLLARRIKVSFDFVEKNIKFRSGFWVFCMGKLTIKTPKQSVVI